MKLSEFESLSQKQQIVLLYHQGIYIGKRKKAGLIRLLFQMDSFYVEITYASYRRSIHKLRFCDSTVILDPYLEQIDVEYLVS
jgi:hypothetical protein